MTYLQTLGRVNGCTYRSKIIAILTSFLCLFSIMTANAQTFFDESGEPIAIYNISYSVFETYHIDNNGVIRLLSTGQILTPQEASDRVKVGAGIVIGIVIGAGAGAAAGIVSNSTASQIFLSSTAGAIGGYYGALAALTTGVIRVMYGVASITVGGAGSTIVTSQPVNNSASCQTRPPGPGCMMVTN